MHKPPPKTKLELQLNCRVSYSLLRLDRFTWDSGRQKKICRAMGMPDMPLFKGGAIHKPSFS